MSRLPPGPGSAAHHDIADRDGERSLPPELRKRLMTPPLLMEQR